MVRASSPTPPVTREHAPIPTLVVEIVSRTSWRRDHEQKRAFYLHSGVAEYWIVDRETRTIRVIVPSADDVLAIAELVWQPAEAKEALVIDVAAYFRNALGRSAV